MFSAPLTAKGAARIATVTRTTDVDRVVEGYRTLETSNVELMRHVVTLKLLAGLRDVSIRTRRVGGIDYGVIAIPINDFGGRRLGAILVAKSLAEPQRKVRVTQVTFLTVTAAGLILLAGAVQLVFNGLLLRPLLQIGDSLDELATGNYGASRDLLRRTDEIGAMAKNVDRIRERLAKEKEEAERKGRVAARLAALHDSEESS
jgi:HAMP domain-containing protein